MPPQIRVRKENLSIGASVILLGVACSISLFSGAGAADFSHAQKVYVPDSDSDRRIDFSSIREQYTLPDQGKKASARTKSGTESRTASSKSTSGHTNKSNSAKTAVKATVASSGHASVQAKSPVSAGKSISDLSGSLSARMSPALIAKMKQTALDLQKSGKLEEAQRLLTRVAQLTPQDKANLTQLATVGAQRARVYLKSNDFQNALLQARTALSAVPENAEANKILGQLYKKVGVDPGDVKNRLKTANTLYQQSRYAEAEVEYKSSLAVSPTAEAYVGIGKIAEKLTGPGAGKQHFEQALELDSNSAIAHRELGLLHLADNDVVSANSELSRALILNPQDKEAGGSLVKLWQTQVSKIPSANSHLGLARAYQLNGDLQSAQAEYREVVRIDPNHPYLPAARQSFKIALARQGAEKSLAAAHSLESQGLISDAYQKTVEAVGYSPGNSAYKIYQGELLEKLGQTAQAKQVYLTVLKDDPQNQAALLKIKELAGLPDTGMSAGSYAPALLPGGNPGLYRQPDGFPGTKFPQDMQANANTLNRAANGMPVDQVGSLANFMTQLRNHMLTSKSSNQKIEDAAQTAIKQITDPLPVGGAASPASGSLPPDLKSLLENPTASAAGGSAAVEGGAAAALANAAAALAAVNGGTASGTPARAVVAGKHAKQHVYAPEKQNKQNLDAPEQLTAAGAGNAAGLPAPAPPPAPDFKQMLQGLTAPVSAPSYQTQQPLSDQLSGQFSNTAPTDTPLLPAIPNAAGLKFELRQIKPTLRDVQLSVALRNESDAAIAIPGNLQAFIKYNNQTESELKVSFEEKSIAPHSTVDGIVKVPFNKVDPSADLVLRNILPGEMHIIKTAISQK